MVTKLSPEVVFRTRRVRKQRRWRKELASTRRTTCHDRNPTDFLENDKRLPIGMNRLFCSLNLHHARFLCCGMTRNGSDGPCRQSHFGRAGDTLCERKFTPKVGARKGLQSPNYILGSCGA